MSIPYNWFKCGRRNEAFSLFELVVVLGVISIVVGLAMPSWHHLLERYYFVLRCDQLWHALYNTRSMAVLRGQTLELCGSRDAQHCDGDWQHAWLIRCVSTGEVLQRVQLPVINHLTVQWSGNFHDRGGLYFDRWGETGGQQGHFDVQLAAYHAKLIIILSGRVRIINDGWYTGPFKSQ